MTTNIGLFAISRDTLGAGSSGKVKVGKNINTGQIVVIKVQLLNVTSELDLADVIEEPNILAQLGQLHAIATRISSNEGWTNKHEQDFKYRTKKYNFKFYILSDFFEGITLYQYFNDYAPTTEKILRIILKVLEKLELLNNLNIIHGDLSFINILIQTTALKFIFLFCWENVKCTKK